MVSIDNFLLKWQAERVFRMGPKNGMFSVSTLYATLEIMEREALSLMALYLELLGPPQGCLFLCMGEHMGYNLGEHSKEGTYIWTTLRRRETFLECKRKCS